MEVKNVAEGYGHALGTSNGNNAATIEFTVVGNGKALKLTFTDFIHLMASTAGIPGRDGDRKHHAIRSR